MRTNPWKLTTLALLAGIVTTSVIAPAVADKQPLMRGALVDLRKAQAKLEKATHDKGGHRVKAIALIKDAMKEIDLGLKFDNQH